MFPNLRGRGEDTLESTYIYILYIYRKAHLGWLGFSAVLHNDRRFIYQPLCAHWVHVCVSMGVGVGVPMYFQPYEMQN